MKSALVVVDVQNYFVNKHTKSLPKRIADYIKNDSGKFDYILFTKFVNKKSSNFFKIMKWKACFSNKDTEISKELQKFSNQNNTFVKSTFSACGSTNFIRFLKSHTIKKLYLCGTDTECCIYASAMDAFDSGFDVKVLSKLCGSSRGRANHIIGIKLLKQNMKKCVV